MAATLLKPSSDILLLAPPSASPVPSTTPSTATPTFSSRKRRRSDAPYAVRSSKRLKGQSAPSSSPSTSSLPKPAPIAVGQSDESDPEEEFQVVRRNERKRLRDEGQ